MAAGDEADPLAVLVEAVERGEKALAGNAEHGVDALGDQRLDQGMAGGAGAARMRSWRDAGVRATSSVPRPRVRLGDRSGFVRMPSNSPFGELSPPWPPAPPPSSRSARATPTARSRRSCARATAEFAAHGFGGARIEAIAERAGVNKKLIYYYFDGKDELFLAVLEQTYADIRAAEHELHLEAAIRCRRSRAWSPSPGATTSPIPEFLALLNSENMHRAGHLKRSRADPRR